MSEKEADVEEQEPSRNNAIVDIECLKELLLEILVCKHCNESKHINISNVTEKKMGLSSYLQISCDKCQEESARYMSKKCFDDCGPYDVNRRSVLASRFVGMGLSKLTKCCALMNMQQPVSKKPWNKQVNYLSVVAELKSIRRLHEESFR